MDPLIIPIDSMDAVVTTARLKVLTAAGMTLEEATKRLAIENENLYRSVARVGEKWQDAQKRYEGVTAELNKQKQVQKDVTAATDGYGLASYTASEQLALLESMSKTFNAELNREIALLRAATGATQAHTTVTKEAAAATGHLHLNTAMARREMFMFARDMAEGHFEQAGRALLNLASHSGLFGAGMLATVAPILAVVAALVGYIYFMVKGHEEQEKFRTALELTNHQAGLTESGMHDLAKSMSLATNVTIGAAKEIVLALVNSGRLGASSIEGIAKLSADFAAATGKDVDKIGADLVKLFDNPLKGAKELDQQMHFLTITELEHIKVLVETGNREEAQFLLMQKVTDALPKQATNVGLLIQEYRDWKKAISDVFDELEKLANRGTPSKAEELDKANAELFLALKFQFQTTGRNDPSEDIDALRRVRDAAKEAYDAEQKQVKAQADAVKEGDKLKATWDDLTKGSKLYELQTLQTALNEQKLFDVRKAFPGDAAAQANAYKVQANAVHELTMKIQGLQEQISKPTAQKIQKEEGLTSLRLDIVKEELALDKQYNDAHHAEKLISDAQFFANERAIIVEGYAHERVALQQHLVAAQQMAALARTPATRDAAALAVAKAEIALVQSKSKEELELTKITIAEDAAERKLYDTRAAAVVALGYYSKVATDARDSVETFAEGLRQEAQALEFQITLIGKSAAEQEKMNAFRRIDLALRAAVAKLPQGGEDSVGAIAGLVELEEAAEKAKKTIAGLIDAKVLAAQSEELANKMARTWRDLGTTISESLSKAFGTAGDAMGGMFKAYSDGTAKQILLSKDLKDHQDKDGNNTAAQLQVYNEKSAQNTVSMYGDMAGAAASYFDKTSTAYKVLHGIEMAMFAIKFAMQLKAMVMDTTATGASVVNSGIRATADGIAAVAKAFGQMGVWGFVGAAAIIAFLAAIGVKMAGGGGGGGGADQSAAALQKQQGSGTVLGDSEAKSDSLLQSIKELEKTNKLGLVYSHQMLTALLSIERSMGNLAATIFRSSGLTSGAPEGVDVGGMGKTRSFELSTLSDQLVGKGLFSLIPGHDKLNDWIFGTVSKEITDSGLAIMGRVGDILAGSAGTIQSYVNVHTSERGLFGGLFGGNSESDSPEYGAVSDNLRKQFGLVFSGIIDSIEAAAKALGQWSPAFSAELRNFVVDIGKVSLMDLKGQDLQDALNGVFSKFADTVSLAFFGTGQMQDLQKAGEGFYQTLIRVATGNEYVQNTWRSLGLTMGQTGMEAITMRMALIDAAGGLENFAKITSDYFERFYSPTEQRANAGAQVQTEWNSMGLTGDDGIFRTLNQLNIGLPKTDAAFRAVVESIGTATPEAAALTIRLMALGPAFSDVINSFVGLDGLLHTTAEAIEQNKTVTEAYDVALGLRTAAEVDAQHRLDAAITPANQAIIAATINLEKWNAGLLTLQSMWEQLFAVQHTEAENLVRSRQLRMLELEAEEERLGLVPYTLRAVQQQINWQADANTQQEKWNEGARIAAGLWNDLFAIQHTEAENLAESRRLRMAELTAIEITNGLIAGSLTSIQKQIDHQIDLNTRRDQWVAGGQKQTALWNDLFAAQHTEAENLIESRRLRMEEIRAFEIANGLVEGSLQGIQRQIDAQMMLNEAIAQQSSLWEQFATPAQKVAQATADVNAGFAALGIAVPASGEIFANLVASIDPATVAGQAFLAALTALAPAFRTMNAEVATAIANYTQVWGYTPNIVDADVARNLDTQLALQVQIFQHLEDAATLAGNAVLAAAWAAEKQAIIEQQHAIILADLKKQDPTGLLGTLQKQLWALEKAAIAAARALELSNTKRDLEIQIQEALGNTEVAEAMRRADILQAIRVKWGLDAAAVIQLQEDLWRALDVQKLKQFTDGLKAWLNGNILSEASPLTDAQKLIEAKRQFEADVVLARGTGTAAEQARARLTQEADNLLALERAVYGFGDEYSAVFASVRAIIGDLAQLTVPAATAGETMISDNVIALRSEVKEMKEVVARLLERLVDATEESAADVADTVEATADKASATAARAVALVGTRR